MIVVYVFSTLKVPGYCNTENIVRQNVRQTIYIIYLYLSQLSARSLSGRLARRLRQTAPRRRESAHVIRRPSTCASAVHLLASFALTVVRFSCASSRMPKKKAAFQPSNAALEQSLKVRRMARDGQASTSADGMEVSVRSRVHCPLTRPLWVSVLHLVVSALC